MLSKGKETNWLAMYTWTTNRWGGSDQHKNHLNLTELFTLNNGKLAKEERKMIARGSVYS